MRLPLVNLTHCPDPGLESLRRVSPAADSWYQFLMWVGVALGFEQMAYALQFLLSRRWRWTVGAVPKYDPPVGLLLLWSLFTAASIVLVATTWRANAAVVAKTAHVATECLILASLLRANGLPMLGGWALAWAVLVFFVVIGETCSDTMLLAAGSGILLDSINFLSHIVVALYEMDNWKVWIVVRGFGWHALYLCSYVGVQRWNLSDDVRAGFRISGMIFNLLATEAFFELVHTFVSEKEVEEGEWCSEEDGSRGKVFWKQGGSGCYANSVSYCRPSDWVLTKLDPFRSCVQSGTEWRNGLDPRMVGVGKDAKGVTRMRYGLIRGGRVEEEVGSRGSRVKGRPVPPWIPRLPRQLILIGVALLLRYV